MCLCGTLAHPLGAAYKRESVEGRPSVGCWAQVKLGGFLFLVHVTWSFLPLRHRRCYLPERSSEGAGVSSQVLHISTPAGGRGLADGSTMSVHPVKTEFLIQHFQHVPRLCFENHCLGLTRPESLGTPPFTGLRSELSAGFRPLL